MVSIEVSCVRTDPITFEPAILLKECYGNRVIPIWTGTTEAEAIVAGLTHQRTTPPKTYDLTVSMLEKYWPGQVHVEITGFDDGVYFAQLVVGDQRFDARPSDSIAIAVRMNAPMYCDQDLFDQLCVPSLINSQDEVEAFVDFIETLDPKDFQD